MSPGLGSSSHSHKEGSQTSSSFRKPLSSLHHIWLTPLKPQMVWDPRNDSPVPTYLQWCGYIQCSQPGYSQFADSQTSTSADWVVLETWAGIMPLYVYPLIQSHCNATHPASIWPIFCPLRVLVYGWSLMCGDLHEISAQYQVVLHQVAELEHKQDY